MAGVGGSVKNCETNRNILRRMVKEGHCIGIHGFDHKYWTLLSNSEWLEQVNVTGSLISEVTNIKSWILRAPGG